MIKTKIFNAGILPNLEEKEGLIDFLFYNLQEYGDPRSDIEKAVNYALKEIPSFGGFIVVSYIENEISGAVVVNQTGMKSYIPENILVYITTHKDHRRKGIGTMLMQKSIHLAEGNVALHVEPENPARFLYEKLALAVNILK